MAKHLIVNAGSSSIKYKIIEFHESTHKELAEGKVEKIGEDTSLISYTNCTNNKAVNEEAKEGIKDHHTAMEKIIEILTAKDDVGVLQNHNDISVVGHRLVHGGDDPTFLHPTRVDDHILKVLHEVKQLAPLHTTANLTGIEVASKLFSKEIPQYVVCDTAFHSTIPPVAYRFAVPDEWFSKYKIRRYGFHGISHYYVGKRTAEYLQRPFIELNLITIHLGNGCSIACIKEGKSIDTSMGFTPLEGLVMGSRSGDVDAGALDYYASRSGKQISEIVKILNTQSGLKGLCGSNDMRAVVKNATSGDEKAKLAYDLFCYTIKKYLGEYFFVLGGKVDAVVFTGGIGEHSHEVRATAMSGLKHFGLAVDPELNESVGKETERDKKKEKKDKKHKKDKKKDSKKDKKKKSKQGDAKDVWPIGLSDNSGIPCLVVQTNEELEIARQIHGYVNK